jgi:Kef-type K+ transport system membrane component KefB
MPFLFLIPVFLLLAGLPSQLQGNLPYQISNFNYIASIFAWLFLFCGFFAMNRGSQWSRLFFVLLALEIVVSAGYSLRIGQSGVIYFLFKLIVAYVIMACVFPLPPLIRLIRRKTKNPRE